MHDYHYDYDDRDDSGVLDKNGKTLSKGQFVYFSKIGASLPPGNYRCGGIRDGAVVWSKPGADFMTSEFTSEYLELLPWKRWKNPDLELKQYLDHREV